MKHYEVRMTMTVAVSVEVNAENVEQAEKLAMQKTASDETYYLSHYDSVWEREVIEVNECKEGLSMLDKGMEYVRETMDAEDVAIIRAQVDRSYRYHMAPGDCVTDHSKVIDLLEEYGEENDLPEGWWEEYGDIDDVLLKL